MQYPYLPDHDVIPIILMMIENIEAEAVSVAKGGGSVFMSPDLSHWVLLGNPSRFSILLPRIRHHRFVR